MPLGLFQLNFRISDKEENVFLVNSENVKKDFQNYSSSKDPELRMEELILKRQIINEVLEMKYFVQSELKKKSTLNIGQFLSSLEERERSLANMILPMLGFTKASPSRNEQFNNSKSFKIFSSIKRDKNHKLVKILQLKKSVESTVRYVKSQVSNNPFWKNNITAINTQLRNTLKDANNILNDGRDQRKQEITELQDRVQTSLYRNQNPQNCQTSRRLVCSVQIVCGFGCITRNIALCMTEALGANRTLVVEIKEFMYKADWTSVLMPFTNTCNLTGTEKRVHYRDPKAKEAQVIFIVVGKDLREASLFRPGTLPEKLAPQLIRLHPDPTKWWTGQIFHYICRPQPAIEEEISKFMKTHRFHEPIVGVHVRRTDKITEDPYVDLHLYMDAVEEWFLQYEVNHNITKLKRKIFLASDEIKVINEAKTSYPHYEIVVNDASNTNYNRSSEDGLHTVVVDLHLLSHCDFLVCTMSSNMCRFSYVLFQSYKLENIRSFFSLDSPYWYNFSWHTKRIAVKTHEPNNKQELMLSPGDIIALPYKFWNGYQRFGQNVKTFKEGIFPVYKTRELFVLAPYENI